MRQSFEVNFETTWWLYGPCRHFCMILAVFWNTNSSTNFGYILEPPGQFLATPWALGVDFEPCGKDLGLISKPSGGHLE